MFLKLSHSAVSRRFHCEFRKSNRSVTASRNHGGVLFLDLRDSSGVLQAVSAPKEGGGGGAHGRAERLRQEWVVRVSGELRLRKDPNPRMPTGASFEACVVAIVPRPAWPA